MALRVSVIDQSLAALEQQLSSVRNGSVADAIERFRGDAAALRFHLRDPGERATIVVMLGGTGTGKSTILNRLLDADLTAASFRRTFTAGPIAIISAVNQLPTDWLGLPHVKAGATPARGEAGRLIIVQHDHELTRAATLVDTPDLDGDQPLHHAQADRAFRWADAVILLVTPEKYQMTELVPYYRLVKRYRVPALFVMNKVEQQAMADDHQARLGEGAANAFNRPHVFAIPRDDANFEPPAEANLNALRQAIASLSRPQAEERHEGLRQRGADLLDRFHDQIHAPLAAERREIDRAIGMLCAMETPPAEIDVNPITRSLARRLQQRSILYLMGPGRVLDRVRQLPALVARLPRNAWDLFMRGRTEIADPNASADGAKVPDFAEILAEQLSVLQSRIDDVIRTSPAGERWIEDDRENYRQALIEPARASTIADEELAELKAWLEKRWNATPRDTAILQKMLKHVPGGSKLTQWSEAAPYLLTIVVATHHAFFGHVDLIILGGYSLATWLTERMSNEVASRTRQANRAIADRFEKLAHEQIDRMCRWLHARAPSTEELERMRRIAESLV